MRRAREAPTRIRMVKGSHIVVRRLFAHDRCYIFQNADGRICFAIPYEQDFTLIGTTDEDYTGDPAAVTPSAEEECLSSDHGERLSAQRRSARTTSSGAMPACAPCATTA